MGVHEVPWLAEVGKVGDRGGGEMDNGDTLPSPVLFCDTSIELLLTDPTDDSIVSGSR